MGRFGVRPWQHRTPTDRYLLQEMAAFGVSLSSQPRDRVQLVASLNTGEIRASPLAYRREDEAYLVPGSSIYGGNSYYGNAYYQDRAIVAPSSTVYVEPARYHRTVPAAHHVVPAYQTIVYRPTDHTQVSRHGTALNGERQARELPHGSTAMRPRNLRKPGAFGYVPDGEVKFHEVLNRAYSGPRAYKD